VLWEEEIREYIEQAEANFQEMKAAAFVNKARLSPVETQNRGKQISLLRKNLNIMKEQFKSSKRPLESSSRQTDMKSMPLMQDGKGFNNKKNSFLNSNLRFLI
jgi:meiotically up-regulated gene 157 (Mug157) protein